MITRVATHLLFQGDAVEALGLYREVFPELKTIAEARYGEGEGAPAGTIKFGQFDLFGHRISYADSPIEHAFSFTPAVSLFIDFDSIEELERCFDALSDGGKVLMPLASYGFSRRFGWCDDRFGVSWQLNCP